MFLNILNLVSYCGTGSTITKTLSALPPYQTTSSSATITNNVQSVPNTLENILYQLTNKMNGILGF